MTVPIGQAKSEKAAVPDKIQAEALNSKTEVPARTLHIHLRRLWAEKQMPIDWIEGYLIKIPKKRDLSKCDDHRGTHYCQ